MIAREEFPSERRAALSIDEAASRLGVSDWAIRQAIKRGEIRARRLGARVLIDPDSIDKFFEAES